jgi:hypothetical protein
MYAVLERANQIHYVVYLGVFRAMKLYQINFGIHPGHGRAELCKQICVIV